MSPYPERHISSTTGSKDIDFINDIKVRPEPRPSKSLPFDSCLVVYLGLRWAVSAQFLLDKCQHLLQISVILCLNWLH